MTLKRRGFMGLLGAALAAPVMPMAAPQIGPQIRALAKAHARNFPQVSALGLSRTMDLPMAQAQRVLLELSRKGLVGPVSEAASGPISAASRVFRPVAAITGPAVSQNVASATRAPTPTHAPQGAANLSAMLRHLHRICRNQGIIVQPRALQVLA